MKDKEYHQDRKSRRSFSKSSEENVTSQHRRGGRWGLWNSDRDKHDNKPHGNDRKTGIALKHSQYEPDSKRRKLLSGDSQNNDENNDGGRGRWQGGKGDSAKDRI